MNLNEHNCLIWETLEARMLLSATGFSISTPNLTTGYELLIKGTTASDQIYVSQSRRGYTITNGHGGSDYLRGQYNLLCVRGMGGNDRIMLDASVATPSLLYGGTGDDTIFGGSGNDSLYGAGGHDRLYGMGGDDTLVDLNGGNGYVRMTGGTGSDSFWLDGASTNKLYDATSNEARDGYIHRISSFMSLVTARRGRLRSDPVSLVLNGPSLTDPRTTESDITYHNFANHPLFSTAGPSANDVEQGYVGDCAFLAVLSSMAKVDPTLIRQSVVDLGDGTYAARFINPNDGHTVFVRVDADLPVWGTGNLAYANFGAQKSTWVAVLEKAFAFFRDGDGAYSSLEAGWMDETYSLLGKTSSDFFDTTDSRSFMNEIKGILDSGRSVTAATTDQVDGTPLVANHAYLIDSVLKDSRGRLVGLRIRNPWGIDTLNPPTDGVNDGWLTITADQAHTAFAGEVTAARV